MKSKRPWLNGVKSKRPWHNGAYVERMDSAVAGRDLGMSQVDAAADAAWKAEAWDFLFDWCVTHPTMFTDELWDEGLPEPREMRALGPLVNKMARRGYIEKAGTRPRAHGRLGPGTVWRSHLFRPGLE